MKTNRPSTLAATLVAVLTGGCHSDTASNQPELAGATDPAQALPTNISASGPTFSSATRDHLVVVDFFATWCDPCRESIPRLNELAHDHGHRGLVVVGVSIDVERDIVREYTADAGIAYDIFHDPEQRYAARHDVSDIPAVLLVGTDGRILYRATKVDDAMVAAVEAALDTGGS